MLTLAGDAGAFGDEGCARTRCGRGESGGEARAEDGAVLGGVLGLGLGALAWALTKRDRAIPETGHGDVDHYEVLVEVEHADRAHELLNLHTSAD